MLLQVYLYATNYIYICTKSTKPIKNFFVRNILFSCPFLNGFITCTRLFCSMPHFVICSYRKGIYS